MEKTIMYNFTDEPTDEPIEDYKFTDHPIDDYEFTDKPVITETIGEVELPDTMPTSEMPDMMPVDPELFSKRTVVKGIQQMERVVAGGAYGFAHMVDRSFQGEEGEKKEPEWVDKVKEFSKQQMQIKESNSSGIIEDVAVALMGSTPFMLSAAIGGPISMGLMMVSMYGDKHEQLTSRGIDEETANDAALMHAIPGAAAEYAGNILQLGAFSKLMKRAGMGMKMSGKGSEVLTAWVQAMAGEGLEEYVQAGTEMLADVYADNPDKSASEIADLATDKFLSGDYQKDALYQGFIGALAGGVFAGVGGTGVGTISHGMDTFATYVQKKNEQIIKEKLGLSDEQLDKLKNTKPADIPTNLDERWAEDSEKSDTKVGGEPGVEIQKNADTIKSGVTLEQHERNKQEQDLPNLTMQAAQKRQKEMGVTESEGSDILNIGKEYLQSPKMQELGRWREEQRSNLKTQRIKQESEEALKAQRQYEMDFVSTEEGALSVASRMIYNVETGQAKKTGAYTPIKKAYEMLKIGEDNVKSLEKARNNLEIIHQNTADQHEQILTYSLDRMLSARIGEAETLEKPYKKPTAQELLKIKLAEKKKIKSKTEEITVRNKQAEEDAETKKLAGEYDERYRQKEPTPYEKIPKTYQSKPSTASAKKTASRQIAYQSSEAKRGVEETAARAGKAEVVNARSTAEKLQDMRDKKKLATSSRVREMKESVHTNKRAKEEPTTSEMKIVDPNDVSAVLTKRKTLLEKAKSSQEKKKIIEDFRPLLRNLKDKGKIRYSRKTRKYEPASKMLEKKGGPKIKMSNVLPLLKDMVKKVTKKEKTGKIKYSKRTKPAPKKTVKAYKLFKVTDGKLRPLYISKEEFEIGVWYDADIGEAGKGGKVKSSIGLLAMRPGLHMTTQPAALHIGEGKPPQFRRNNEVWAEVEVPADVDWDAEAQRRAKINKKGLPIARTAQITDQIPADGHYRYKTNANAKGEWVIAGAMKVNKILTDEEVALINKETGLEDLPRRDNFNAENLGLVDKHETASKMLEKKVTKKEKIPTYKKEFEIAETGEKVIVKIKADEALDQIENDLFSLQVLKDCIG